MVSEINIGQIITVKNADGDADTTATVLIQNKINYTPKVSVIMPVYNVERYLRECLDSVTNQTLKEIEIICVDDGSTDKSLDILKEYAVKDNRITVITQENLHAGIARNAGLTVALGKYLSFLDSDDFFELNMLEEMHKKAIENKSDIVICNWDIQDEIKNIKKQSADGVPTWVKEIIEKKPEFNFATKQNTNLTTITNPAPWNKLYKADFVKKTGVRFQSMTCCNDIGFSVTMMALAHTINIINAVFVHYRKYSSNTSHTTHDSTNIIKAAKYIKSNLQQFDVLDNLTDAFYRGISTSFYYEYCRCTDLQHQRDKYREFLPDNYYKEFLARYDLDRKRKICLIGTDNVCTTTGGALTVFWERAEYFQNLGFNVVCVYENKDNTCLVNNGIRKQNLWGYKNSEASTSKRFGMFLEQEKPDVLIFLMPSVVFRYTNDLDISKYTSILMVHSRPDVYFEENPNKDNLLKACSKINYMQVLLPSFIPMLKTYFPKTKVCVIPNYVNFVKKELINNAKHKKLIFFSRCDVGKNISLLINAYKIVHDKYPDWSLEIYGESEPPSYIDKCKHLADILKITDNIKFISRSPIGRDILATGDIFVFPSYFEGFGLGLFEALSAGLPAVVLNKCTGANEIIQDGVNGLFAEDNPQDFADKIITLIENKNLCKQMGCEAVKSIRPFTKESVETAWFKFIVDTINKTFVEPNISATTKECYSIPYIHSVWDDFNPKCDKPDVSIIVPVYNTVGYIDECIQSLQNQTFKNIEIICIDDRSTDGSYEKLCKYQENDYRIKIYRNTTSKKQGYSRNYGIQKARGKYIFFCDSDDFIKPETIENLYKKIEQNDAEICQCLLCLYHNSTKQIELLPNQNFDSIKDKKKEVYSYKDDPNIIFNRVEPVLKLYKRDFLVNNSIKFLEGCYFEDTIVHIKCMSLAKKICFDDNIYYFYRRERENQTTGSSKDTTKFLDIFNYINLAENFFKDNNLWKELKQYYYKFCLERFCSYYNRSNEATQKLFSEKVKDWFKNKNKRKILSEYQEYKTQIMLILKQTIKQKSLKPYLLFPWYFTQLYKLRFVYNRVQKKSQPLKKYPDVSELPKICSDIFLPLGSTGQPAYWLGRAGLKQCKTPFDGMKEYKLDFVVETLRSQKINWFSDFTEKNSTTNYHCVKDNLSGMYSLNHFPKECSVKDYLPEFLTILYYNNEQLKQILSNIPNVCFVTNRSETVCEILKFMKDILKLFNIKNLTVINVRHSDTDKGVYTYKLKNRCVLYDIVANNTNTEDNVNSWRGNPRLWENILNKLEFANKNHKHKIVKSLPQIHADAFISVGPACRSAYQLQKANLRQYALPFDWMISQNLNFVIETLKSKKLNWFNYFLEEPSDIKHRHVTDKISGMISLHHFPKEYSVKDYLPVFHAIFNRRNERFKKILATKSNICFVANRSDSVAAILKFMNDIMELYNIRFLTFINVRHSDTDKNIYKYKLNDRCVLYDIYANDIHENGNDPKTNRDLWKGNTQLWNNITSKLKLNSSNEECDDEGANLDEVLATINLKQNAFKSEYNKLLEQMNDSWIKQYQEILNKHNELSNQIKTSVVENRSEILSKYTDLDAKLKSVISDIDIKHNELSEQIGNVQNDLMSQTNTIRDSQTQIMYDVQNEMNNKIAMLGSQQQYETDKLRRDLMGHLDDMESNQKESLDYIQNEINNQIDTMVSYNRATGELLQHKLTEQIKESESNQFDVIEMVNRELSDKIDNIENKTILKLNTMESKYKDSLNVTKDEINNRIDSLEVVQQQTSNDMRDDLSNKVNTLSVEHKDALDAVQCDILNKLKTIESDNKVAINNIQHELSDKIDSVAFDNKNAINATQRELNAKLGDNATDFKRNLDSIYNDLSETLSNKFTAIENTQNELDVKFDIATEQTCEDINKIKSEFDNMSQQNETRYNNIQQLLTNLYTAKTNEEKDKLEFRTFGNLAYCIRSNLYKIPEDIDLVVGIPRSGMIPAYIIALFMNKKCCSLDEFIAGIKSSNGFRNVSNKPIKNILVIDDSIFSGSEMSRVREKLSGFTDYNFKYMAVYARTESKDKVDVYLEIVDGRRVWQWNYLNHSIAGVACFDMDGVLCVDPTDDQNDDGEKYIDFIKNAKPLYIPKYKIRAIVTSRLEKYRKFTEEWLAENGVKYDELIMLDLPNAEERRKLACHADFKAEVYKRMVDTKIFIESDPYQAKKIATITGKQVLCVKTDELF